MGDEIKEIQYELNILSNTILDNTTYCPTIKRRKLLLDYITNLQQQLHQASLDIQELTERDIGCPSWCDKLTNLQQEIKEANDSITWWTNRFKAVERDNRELKEEIERQSKAQVILDDMLADYGYRIDKAIEYINTHDDCFYQEKGLNEDSLNVLLNILQNGSEE